MPRQAIKPEDRTTPVNISMPYWMAIALKRKSEREDRAISAIVRQALIKDGLLKKKQKGER